MIRRPLTTAGYVVSDSECTPGAFSGSERTGTEIEYDDGFDAETGATSDEYRNIS